MKSLILEGFMGCGKSSVALKLSKELGMPLFDTDARIEERQGRSINGIFEGLGEAAFRDMETEELKRLQSGAEAGIISLGGGMPVRAENREILKKLGTVVYLKAPKGLLYERLLKENESDSRPMLKGHDLKERISRLLDEREGDYLSAADFTVGINEKMSVEDVVFAIRKACGI